MSFPGWLLFAAIALVFWGSTGITQKLATNRISSELSFLWFAYAMIAISAVLVFTVPMHWHVRTVIFWLALAGGTLNSGGPDERRCSDDKSSRWNCGDYAW